MTVKKPNAPTCRIFGIKNCDTMKKAFACLDAQGTVYEFIDYKKAGIAAAQLPDWAARVGWQTLLNTRGLMWRKLSDEQRADVDEQKAMALMAEYPSLIKRPLLDTGTALLVGFDAAAYARLK
jgi:arsenate reductase (glutaredoxin)